MRQGFKRLVASIVLFTMVFAGIQWCIPVEEVLAAESYYWPTPTVTDIYRGYSSGHTAIDISTPEGTPVYSTKSGTVWVAGSTCECIGKYPYCAHRLDYRSEYTYGAGTFIVIRHDDGTWAEYSHLLSGSIQENVYSGARVSQGQLLALSGNTGNSSGPHLHFRISTGTEAAYYLSTTINNNKDKIAYVYDWNSSSTGYTYIDNSTIFSNVYVTDITNTTAKICADYTRNTYDDVGFLFAKEGYTMPYVSENKYGNVKLPIDSYSNSYTMGKYYDDTYEYKWWKPLEPGTKYYYAFYVRKGSTVYVSSKKTFTTTAYLTGIDLSTNTISLNKGDTDVLTVSYNPANTTDNKNVTWSSSNNSVVQVDSSGNITAVGVGTAVITATVGSFSDSCTITVKNPLKGISLNKTSLTLDAGNTSTLSVNYNPTDTTDSKSVSWSSSDLSVATVDSNGKVTAVAAGTAIITAKVGNYTASCTITVNAQEVIRINKDALTLRVGETSVLSVIFNSSELTGSEKVVWCSSDFDVFTVYQSGEVVAKGAGTAYVTVIVDEKYKATCTVNVIDDRTPLEKFVARMYTIALKRDVDATGHADWVGGLTAGTYDGATVGRGVFLSPEFTGFGLSNDEYLNRLYYTFFDRAPDDSGKQNWLNHLSAGYSREYILSEFINSEEFTNLCQSFDVERGVMMSNGSVVNIGIPKFVSRLYSTVMGRTADWQGYTNWTNTLVVKAQNAQIVATTFFLSPEYLNKNTSNTEFITDLYEAFFDRAPDSSGMTNWKNQLNSGMSRETMVGQFANSAEFKNLAAKYGLE